MRLTPVSAIASLLIELKPTTIWLGFSGGLDSTVLLHATAQAASKFPDITLQAIHIHHGLSPLADQWAEHCHDQAKNYGIDCHIERLSCKPQAGESIEAWAREGRYACFKRHIKPGDVLLTAHHQDDQAETVLLQLLRGSGPKGLSAMAPISPCGAGLLARPFLAFSRLSLEEYAKHHNLSYTDDHSNADTRYDRNFIRHEIMPIIKQRFANAPAAFARSALNCAEQEQVLAEFMNCPLPPSWGRARERGKAAHSLSIPELQSHSPAKRNLILRAWIDHITDESAGRSVLHSIESTIFNAKEDAKPLVVWGDWEFRRYQNQLYLMKALGPIPENYNVSWDGKKPLQVPTWPIALTKEYLAEQGLNLNKIDWSQVSIKLRQGGERCTPLGRGHSQTLKKCLQEYTIPPWLRDRMPLLYSGTELIMVVGAFVCQFKLKDE
ncbi:MAG: tRNA lysidine(34) synthetase TilS [Gammaproteobacteria bacterium]|nr:tRNA lysidine(34) synthetase TilS [Gammaproteobacteria bacterium]